MFEVFADDWTENCENFQLKFGIEVHLGWDAQIVEIDWIELFEIVDEIDDVWTGNATDGHKVELFAVDELEKPIVKSIDMNATQFWQFDAFWIFIVSPIDIAIDIIEIQNQKGFALHEKLADLNIESTGNVIQMKNFDVHGDVGEIDEKLEDLSIVFGRLISAIEID